jgi:hypothetical protein
MVDRVVLQGSGPEVCVVSTKAALAQMILLARLARDNNFTERQNSPEPVYRYHQLLRDFLMERAHTDLASSDLAALIVQSAHTLEESGAIEDAAQLQSLQQSNSRLAKALAWIVNALADGISCWLLIRLAGSFGERRAGIVAAAIWAIAPMSVTFASGAWRPAFSSPDARDIVLVFGGEASCRGILRRAQPPRGRVQPPRGRLPPRPRSLPAFHDHS